MPANEISMVTQIIERIYRAAIKGYIFENCLELNGSQWRADSSAGSSYAVLTDNFPSKAFILHIGHELSMILKQFPLRLG